MHVHPPAGSAPAHRGGTLIMLGQSDIFNLDPVSAYYTVSTLLERMFARQPFTYPSVASWNGQITVVPDIATEIPAVANGGITDNGRACSARSADLRYTTVCGASSVASPCSSSCCAAFSRSSADGPSRLDMMLALSR